MYNAEYHKFHKSKISLQKSPDTISTSLHARLTHALSSKVKEITHHADTCTSDSPKTFFTQHPHSVLNKQKLCSQKEETFKRLFLVASQSLRTIFEKIWKIMLLQKQSQIV